MERFPLSDHCPTSLGRLGSCFLNLIGFTSVITKVFRFDRCEEQGVPLMSPFHEIFLFHCNCDITSYLFLLITRVLNSLLTPVYCFLVLITTQEARAALCYVVELASYTCAFLNYFCMALCQCFCGADMHQSANLRLIHCAYL
jgi:hypothetical protein